jgi:hypothetical protein
MSKSKKQKKAEANAAKALKQAGSKKKEKPIAEAMKKAEAKTAVQSVRIVKGFQVRSVNSKIVHAIVGVTGELLCDARVQGFKGDPKLTVADCTCKRCLSYTVVKQLLTVPEKPKPKEKAKPEVKTKTPAKSSTSPKTVFGVPVKQKEPTTPVPPDDACVDEIIDQIKAHVNIKFRVIENKLLAKLEKYIEQVLHRRPEYFICMLASQKYQIVHDPSRLVIINGMSQENAEHILLELCSLPIKWSGHGDLPKTWISAIRKVNEKWIAVEKEQTDKKKSEVSEGTTLKSRRPRKRYKKAGQETVNDGPKLSVRRRRGR